MFRSRAGRVCGVHGNRYHQRQVNEPETVSELVGLFTSSSLKQRSTLGGRLLQGVQGHRGVRGVEQAVELGAAGGHVARHRGPDEVGRLHLLLDLPGEQLLQRLGLDLLADALLVEKIVEGRTDPPLLRPRSSRSGSSIVSWRSSISPGGVCCVFLMKPCSRTMAPSRSREDHPRDPLVPKIAAHFP